MTAVLRSCLGRSFLFWLAFLSLSYCFGLLCCYDEKKQFKS